MKIRILSLVCALVLLLGTCGCENSDRDTLRDTIPDTIPMEYWIRLDSGTLYYQRSTVDPTNPQKVDVGLWAYDTGIKAITRLSKTRGYF